jgi:triosephosphate isomerase
MTTYILANWKSNKTRSEAVLWLETFLEHYIPLPDLKVIIAPPAVFLDPLKQILDQHKPADISLAIQDISPFPTGSYTGACAADMLRNLVDFAIVGHSERRHHFHETHAEIARKTSEAQGAGITPILCIDRPYAIEQIAALEQTALDNDILIGFGPVHAINQEPALPSEQQKKDIQAIQKMIPNQTILYGGSVNAENGPAFLQIPGISGLMVASASLDAQEFARICTLIGKD